MQYVMATDRAEGEGPPPPKRTRVDTPETAAEGQQDSLLGIVDHHFEPPALPDDWVAVLHVSGATVYLHRPSRVVTLSRPYRVSTSITVRKHGVYIQSVPCMEQWLFGRGERSQLAQDWITRAQGKQNRLTKTAHLREYLSLRWDPSLLARQQESQNESSEQGGSGGTRGEGEGGRGREEMKKETVCRKNQQQQKRKKSPLVPEGLSRLVSVKVPVEYRKMVEHPEGKRPPAIWQVNTANKNSIVLLYEFCQSYLHTSPDFTFTQATSQYGPSYQCDVKVGGVRYGSGRGDSKKIAKLAAAGQTLELFLPGAFSEKLTPSGSSLAGSSEEGLQLLSHVSIDDPRAPAILEQTGFPTPWHTLRTTLQWNQGFFSEKLTLDLQPLPDLADQTSSHAHSTAVPQGHQFECVLRCGWGGGEGEGGGEEVRVTCVGRKDGQAAAAQAMLKKLHPYITNWGSLLQLYSHSPSQTTSNEPPPLPPSSATEGRGLLSEADQQLLHSLRHQMSLLARQRSQEASSEPVTASQLHQTHIRLSHPPHHHRDTNTASS